MDISVPGILSFVGDNSIDGHVFSVEITGLKAGMTQIELDKVNLIQDDGSNVPCYNSITVHNEVITILSD